MSSRNPYLINKAFRTYLMSTVMSTMAVTFGSVLGSIVVGHVLGANALGAVSSIMPIIQMLAALNALINIGGATVMAVHMGRGNLSETRGIFTKSMLMSLALSIVIAVIGVAFIDDVVGALCDDDVLFPMAKQYGTLVFAMSPLYMMMPGLGTFIRVDNAPRLATIAFVVSNVVNLVFAYALMGFTDMGVSGFAVATGLGYVAGIIVMVPHLLKKECSLRFGKGTVRISEILSMGSPTSLAMLFIMVNMIGMNVLVIDNLGSDGMAIRAVCNDIQLIASIFISGISQTIQPVGGSLYGSEDLTGMRLVTKIAMKYQVAATGAVTLIAFLFPVVFLYIYGITDMSIRADAIHDIRLFAPCLMIKAVDYLIMVIFQVFGHRKLALSISTVECLAILVASFALTPVSTDFIWFGFVIGEAFTLVYIVALSLFIRKIRPEFSGLLLLRKPEGDVFDLSMPGDGSTMTEVLDDIERNLKDAGVEMGVVNRVGLCCEEILSNVVEHGVNGDPEDLVDIIVRITDSRVLVTVRDDGKMFDPIKYDSKGLGLPIIKGQCTDLNYTRAMNQNNVFMGFSRNTA